MQLRTVKKPKSKEFDFWNSGNGENVSNKKVRQVEQNPEKDAEKSSNEVKI
jgi:hypothetical protein